ncbi:MAG TPA: LPS-assembly protein LptD [Steroidobacteraceae bacterium]|nr:LPS-assembly protein LptD [Steroidobacteraceae bacterium]
MTSASSLRYKSISRLRVFSPLSLLLTLAAWQTQAQTCPDTTSPGIERPGSVVPKLDYSSIPVLFSFDGGNSILNGESDLTGAKASQGNRSITADTLHYDFATKSIKADGNVSYEDDQFQVSGRDANMDSNAGVEFNQAGFALKSRAGRGSATSIQLSPQGNLHLDTVRYTTCPANKPDWELQLSSLDINQATRTGTGRNVRLEFKGVPLFYTPWISFPVGNERKSGFLFPNFRSSSRGGYSLLVPWYWNIAPNYDATFTPIIDSRRGAELDSEFRYLSDLNQGNLMAAYLPHDPTRQDWRGLVQLKHQTDFNPQLRLFIDGSSVSDRNWFEDFGQSRDETSQVYLTRTLNFSAYSDNWMGSIAVQNLQILDLQMLNQDPTVTVDLLKYRPYTMLPQISVTGHETQLPFGFDFDLESEATYFVRNARDIDDKYNVTGARLYAAPTLSLPLRTSGMYVIPSSGWRYTAYQLHSNSGNQPTSPTLSAPISSLDMGMIFERISKNTQRLYTLQPRVLYTYIPFRNQADLPNFDTGLPDFNLVQLFNTDRFIGHDRLGDTNQISTGVTTRMLDAGSGRQFLSGTLGQIFYLRSPCVTDLYLLPATCNHENTTHSSPMIGQIALTAYRNWSASMGMQWNPIDGHTERSEVNFQYLPAHNKVINLSYRFARATRNLNSNTPLSTSSSNQINDADSSQTNQVDQWESSVAWPVGVNWGAYGRVVYSRLDNALHDYLAGIEYRSCCWNLRLVFGRSITTRAGTYDTRANLQFEFKGLGSAGNADAFLQNAIPGYSAKQP